MNKFLLTIFACLFFGLAFCHDIHEAPIVLRDWTIAHGNPIQASFLMFKDDKVFLEKENSEIVSFPLSDFSSKDQVFVKERYAHITQINQMARPKTIRTFGQNFRLDYAKMTVMSVFLILLFMLTMTLIAKKQYRSLAFLFAVSSLSLFYSFNNKKLSPLRFHTSVATIDSAFTPFKPNINTFSDANYFYVESKGIPTTHDMMVGITAWQQQVPLPQCYIGSNAWSIPLNPTIATTPVPVSPQHFSRGAIALAVNGVPIFNPYTNTGVDAYLDGQLDNWGGHSGRADDYHYHTAPLHLYGFTSNTLPIAYALDGFPVYGSVEPNGAAMLPLDANNGHYGTNGVYHYHGVAAAPYMIGNMVGQITEDTTHQIIPQAAAHPVRPSLTPLQGAVITNWATNGPNGYILTYTKGGQSYQVSYSWTATGVYTYNFISPTGTTTSTYNGFKPCDISTDITSNVLESKQISLFPNPSQQEFSLKFSNNVSPSDIKNIAIISQTGQIVFSTNGYTEKIKTSDFAKGMYFVLIRTDKNTISKKLVVE